MSKNHICIACRPLKIEIDNLNGCINKSAIQKSLTVGAQKVKSHIKREPFSNRIKTMKSIYCRQY